MGFKSYERNIINSPKLYLGMIFKNINLDDVTCI
jgi:hypothetical protein